MYLNVPQFIDFYKCSSGSRIPGSQFFAGLVKNSLVLHTLPCVLWGTNWGRIMVMRGERGYLGIWRQWIVDIWRQWGGYQDNVTRDWGEGETQDILFCVVKYTAQWDMDMIALSVNIYYLCVYMASLTITSPEDSKLILPPKKG